MIEVYFYKEKELKYSVYANIIEDVIGNPLAYYEGYTADMIISSIKYINPVFENNELREATREELVAQGIEIQLEDGELIKEKKLIKIEQPSIHHNWNGTEWTVDLEKVKKVKREELKVIRDSLCKEDLNLNGSLIQVRNAEDREKFERIILGLLLKTISLEQAEEWRLADNTYRNFTYAELSQVPQLYSNREREIFKKFKEIETQLNFCNSVEEIETIKWE